jgi:hypothetical protein
MKLFQGLIYKGNTLGRLKGIIGAVDQVLRAGDLQGTAQGRDIEGDCVVVEFFEVFAGELGDILPAGGMIPVTAVNPTLKIRERPSQMRKNEAHISKAIEDTCKNHLRRCQGGFEKVTHERGREEFIMLFHMRRRHGVDEDGQLELVDPLIKRKEFGGGEGFARDV